MIRGDKITKVSIKQFTCPCSKQCSISPKQLAPWKVTSMSWDWESSDFYLAKLLAEAFNRRGKKKWKNEMEA